MSTFKDFFSFKNDEGSSKKTFQMGLLNADTDVNIPISVDAKTYNNNKTFSPTYTDARQISIIEGNDNVLTSKKEDSVAGSTNPVNQTGSSTPISVPVDLALPQFNLPSISNTLLIGGLVVVGGSILLSKNRGKK